MTHIGQQNLIVIIFLSTSLDENMIFMFKYIGTAFPEYLRLRNALLSCNSVSIIRKSAHAHSTIGVMQAVHTRTY